MVYCNYKKCNEGVYFFHLLERLFLQFSVLKVKINFKICFSPLTNIYNIYNIYTKARFADLGFCQ